MKTEIEAKFLNVNFDDLRIKLNAHGAICTQPMRDMRRAVIQPPELKKERSFIRIRDEGNKITLTYKKFDKDLTVDGAREIEVEVSDFDATISIFKQAGLGATSFQESRRETWVLNGVEVVLDQWPWLSPYIEIEGMNEDDLHAVAGLLGFMWKDAVFGDVMAAYRAEYPHLKIDQTVGTLDHVRFSDPLPALLKI